MKLFLSADLTNEAIGFSRAGGVEQTIRLMVDRFVIDILFDPRKVSKVLFAL
jgi:hypothetical protein